MKFSAEIVDEAIIDGVIIYLIKLRTPAANHILIQERYSSLRNLNARTVESIDVEITRFPKKSILTKMSRRARASRRAQL